MGRVTSMSCGRPILDRKSFEYRNLRIDECGGPVLVSESPERGAG
jgi:hypothetical protein